MQILSRRSATGRALGPFICQSCKRSLRKFSITTARPRGPPPPPPSGYAHLTSRRLISIAGSDAPKFLHGIITQSVVDEAITGGRQRQNAQPRITAANSTIGAPGFYTGFLNATGRVLHDVFIYRDTLGIAGGDAAEGEAFVIEVDAAQVEALAKHIKRYKLRSKLKFRILDEEECVAWQVWDDSTSAFTSASPSSPAPIPSTLQQLAQQQPKDFLVLQDARAPGMGFRVLSSGGGGGAQKTLEEALELPRSDDAAYRVRRYLRGVAEGQAEIPREHALPLESNMDVTGGIDFRKGCYVGQELTIRTRHRGVVRKRILPCLLYPSTSTSTSSQSPPPPQQLEYNPYIVDGSGEGEQGKEGLAAEDVPAGLSIGRAAAKGRSAGTWLTGAGNVGLALCRLPIMTDVELPGETAAGAPFNPQADEFVVRWGADAETGQDGRSLKVKAFVPDWLRERLREDNDSASAH
ncbi:Aminomethyltransferase folate-binding domain-containing protein [Hypoxylon rubiginosum]|uniref:Aminomethyltransferase folate-binding domain-containing protein n=1 Tax=Hypoxylon rubiginosum TaxID=110542 RepID=A0ACB9ZAU1_9PEZI|nr:Aminomethyltransferase folate-binding domain-containing protein [Hypoxylon rubiginosum]